MAETVGALIISAETAAAVAASASAATGLTITAAAVTQVVGTAAILAASIGLSYALNNVDIPKPEAGAQALKQAIPPRVRGYWVNRLSGSYVYYTASATEPNSSYDAIAFHHGVITEVLAVYLSDDQVSVVAGSLAHGAVATVQGDGGMYGGGQTFVQVNYGHSPQLALLQFAVDVTSEWTTAFHGNGIASAALACGAFGDPAIHSRRYPKGKPELSLLVKCTPIWDPRDGGQDPDDESTWVPSPNPVLQLLDYLIRPGSEGGMGHDRDVIFPPARLAQWMEEADLCEGNYVSAGWYRFDNKPEDVINKILATCDGYMMEDGEGTFVLTIGIYREPTDPPITDDVILGWSVDHGVADEQVVNQLDVSYTEPTLKYASAQVDSIRDEESISASGIVRAQQLDLSWVQLDTQASILGERALLRLNPEKTGSIVTTLYGFRWLGKRWLKLQLAAVAGLQDCVIEIQGTAIDVLAGRITFKFNTVDPEALLALQ